MHIIQKYLILLNILKYKKLWLTTHQFRKVKPKRWHII